MKSKVRTTALTCLVLLLFSFVFFRYGGRSVSLHALTVGFLYAGDESTPYTYGFLRAQENLEEAYPREVKTYTQSNVPEEKVKEALLFLIKKGCTLIFTNSRSSLFQEVAATHPQVQFCQLSLKPYEGEKEPLENYHTFQAETYQARYLSGIIAGFKLQDLVESRVITPVAATLGFVACSPSAEDISAYTAFFLGVRHVMPKATMKVYYTGEHNNYFLEKACTEKLIQEGCQVISQSTDSLGPAIACENSFSLRKAYFIGYNQPLQKLAPASCLSSIAPDYTPYIQGAARALLAGESIEKMVAGNLHPGNDLSASFSEGWLSLLDVNFALLPYAVQRNINQTLGSLHKNPGLVFSGNYLGVSPWDENDTWDLNTPYEENKNSSSPTFHYVLKDVIKTEDFEMP